MRGRRKARLAFAAALAASAATTGSCAFDRGEAMGTVEATLEAQLSMPADRDLGDGFQELASDYQVRVTRFDLELDALLLEDLGASTPPSTDGGECLDEHCHEVAHAEGEGPERELGGEPTVAMAFEVGTIPLVGGAPRALDCGDCTLRAGRVGQVRLVAHRLVVELEVRDGRDEPRFAGTRRAAASIDLEEAAEGAPHGAGELTSAVDVPVGEDEPRVVSLSLSLAPSSAFFDEVGFAGLASGGDTLDLEGAADLLRASFQAQQLQVHVERRDE